MTSARRPGVDRRQAIALCAGAVPFMPAAAALRIEHHFLFGSPVELLLPPVTPQSIVDAVIGGLIAIHSRWNAWKPGEVRDLNEAFRLGRPGTASPALRSLIRQSAWLEARSLGCFNPGIGGLVGAWGFHDDVMRPGTRPQAAALEPWLAARPSLAQIEIRGASVSSRNPGLQLDFGGVAKGAAIDAALDRLRAQGVHDALLNLGGNLAVMGNADTSRGRGWTVGIRDPAGPGLLATLQTEGREAVVTSGSYERFRVLDGERCTHILDPVRGAPAAEIVSVTVVHPSATLADAAATALLVAGPARWRVVAARLGIDRVLVVDRQRRVGMTPRLAPQVQAVRIS